MSRVVWGSGLLAIMGSLWLTSGSTEAAVVPAGGSLTYFYDLSSEQPAAPYMGISFFVDFEGFADRETLDIRFGFNDPQGAIKIVGPALSIVYNDRHLNACAPSCGAVGTLTFAAAGGPISVASVQVTGFNGSGTTNPVQATVPLPAALALFVPALAGLATLRGYRRYRGQAAV